MTNKRTESLSQARPSMKSDMGKQDWLDDVLEQYWKQRHGMYNANQDDVEMANREAKDAIANKIVELVLKDRKARPPKKGL